MGFRACYLRGDEWLTMAARLPPLGTPWDPSGRWARRKVGFGGPRVPGGVNLSTSGPACRVVSLCRSPSPVSACCLFISGWQQKFLDQNSADLTGAYRHHECIRHVQATH
jgi:hypothetical protein